MVLILLSNSVIPDFHSELSRNSFMKIKAVSGFPGGSRWILIKEAHIGRNLQCRVCTAILYLRSITCRAYRIVVNFNLFISHSEHFM